MRKYKPYKRLHQTGKSKLKRDKMYKAKAVGRRKSASKKVYYEYRRNRSDKNRRKRL